MPKKKSSQSPKNGAEERLEAQFVRANVNREVVVSPTFVTLYANDTQIHMSPWDFRLMFGEISALPTPGNPTVTIKQTGEVRMSPQHVKKVVSILLLQLADYEKRFGTIPQPSD